MTNIHQFTVKNGQGQEVDLASYRGKVVLIVNTASQCGFTPQYQQLEALYQQYKDRNFEILAFPCNQFGSQEPGDNSDIQQFCQLNYGLSFPVMAKINVNGVKAAPLFEHLKDSARGLLKTRAIKWNFTKFLINKQGDVVKRYAPRTKPASIAQAVEDLL
ncbi:MAG: glutathione peroxidase [Rheinheimera sp.]|uniref:glutathione peroxidase n=1 Tax=Arsukibacterium sp. UBA3155 TaxID=1946058 RepID=UPI000C8D6883|nr:glutathione peroxidase [Arsukibacterium sp. UBA3155]MAD74011.1 glutathione peroxidase [Rheinheimera sp.]|tara:strand:+ start:67980 stop:68459 length:480 start_codon:yes stop_codon:yes gene_type:complete